MQKKNVGIINKINLGKRLNHQVELTLNVF